MASSYSRGDHPVPDFELVEPLGQGGFGVVWRATGPGGIQAAVKIINLTAKQAHKEFRGLQRVKQLRHPNLVPIYGFWLKDDRGAFLHDTEQLPEADFSAPPGTGDAARAAELIIAMGLGDKALSDRLDECKHQGAPGIGPEELFGYIEDAARALDYLHANSVQHCDIKPSNIMIVGGAAQVCDFGLARLLGDVRSTAAAVSPAYSAPEFLRDNSPSATTDQYSLAITYHELRVGELPFPEGSVMEVMRAHMEGRLDFSGLSAAERDVMRRATALDAAARYGTTLAMVRALRQAYEGTSTPASSPQSSATGTKAPDELVPGYRPVRQISESTGEQVWEAQGPAGCVALVVRELGPMFPRPDLAALEIIRGLEHDHLTELRAFWLLDDADNVLPEGHALQGARKLVVLGRLARKTLKQLLDEARPADGQGLPPEKALRYTRQMAEALDALGAPGHEVGGQSCSIQHRAVRPQNVMCRGDSVLVGNFLSACVLQGPATVVSDFPSDAALPYAPPESFDRVVTRWSDQYSLAITYFELRTGRLPFPGGLSTAELAELRRSGTLDLSELPEAERRAITRATAMTPEERYPCCVALVQALEQACGTSREVASELRVEPAASAPPSITKVPPAPPAAPRSPAPPPPPPQPASAPQDWSRQATLAPPPFNDQRSEVPRSQRETLGSGASLSETPAELPAVPPTPDRPRESDSFLIGERYELKDLLGEGAFAVVYRARDRRLDQDVAVKLLRLEHTSDPARLLQLGTLFSREARMLATLRHPHIVQVLDTHITSTGIPYIVTEYLEGTLLREVLNTEGALSLERTDKLLKQMCAAVDAAHEAKVVHRDLKPNNLMLMTRHGEESLEVLDFGLAKLVDQAHMSLTEGTPMGTPAYMSPEQHRGADANPASDIYSIGVILFEMLTGRLPFEADDLREMARLHCQESPPDPQQLRDELSSGVAAVLLKGLEKDSAKRYKSAMELYEAFRKAYLPEAYQSTVHDFDSTLHPPVAPPTNPWPKVAVLVAAIALVAGAVVLLVPRGGSGVYPHMAAQVTQLVNKEQFEDAVDAVRVPGNGLDDEQRSRLLERVLSPWRAQAQAALDAGDGKSAAGIASAILEKVPDDRTAAQLRKLALAGVGASAREMVQSGDGKLDDQPEQALEDYRVALALLGDNPDPELAAQATLGAARALARLDRWQNVRDRLAELPPEHAEAPHAVAVKALADEALASDRVPAERLELMLPLKQDDELIASLDDWEREAVVALGRRLAEATFQQALTVPADRAAPLVDVILQYNADHPEARKLRRELDAIAWADGTTEKPGDVDLAELFPTLLEDAPYHRSELYQAYARLALENPQDHLAGALETLRPHNDPEARRLRGVLLAKKIEFSAVAVAPEGFEQLLADCEEAAQATDVGSWVQLCLAECLVETRGDTDPLDVVRAGRAASVDPQGVPIEYAYYVRGLVEQAARPPNWSAAAEQVHQAFAAEPLPVVLDNAHRRAQAARILEQAAGTRRAAQSTLGEAPFAQPDDARTVYDWLSLADRLLGDEADLSLASRVNFVLASWQTGQVEAARRLADQIVADEQFDDLGQDRFAVLLIHAQSQADNAVGRAAALDTYDRLREAALEAGSSEAVLLATMKYVLQPAIELGQRAVQAGANAELREQLATFYGAKGKLLREEPLAPWPIAGAGGDAGQRALEAAREAYQAAVRLDPKSPRYRVGRGLALLDLADPSHDQKALYEQLLEEAEAAIPLDDDYAGGHGLKGFALHGLASLEPDLAERTEHERRAIEAYGEAIQRSLKNDPDALEEGSELGTYYMNRSISRLLVANYVSDFDTKRQAVLDAIDDAKAAVKSPMRKKDWAYNALGNAYEDLGWLIGDPNGYAEAVKAFDQAVTEMPESMGLLNRGRCYAKWLVHGGARGAQSRDFVRQRALTYLQDALDQATTDRDAAEAAYWLGYLHDETQPVEAERFLQQAVNKAEQADPHNLGFYRAARSKAMMLAARTLGGDAAAQKAEQARREAEQAKTEDSAQAGLAQWVIGQSWDLQGDDPRAEDAYRAGLELDNLKSEHEAALRLGLAITIQKRLDPAAPDALSKLESAATEAEAAASLERASHLRRATALIVRGLALHRAAGLSRQEKHYRQAAEAFDEVGQRAPDHPDAWLAHYRRSRCYQALVNLVDTTPAKCDLLKQAIQALQAAQQTPTPPPAQQQRLLRGELRRLEERHRKLCPESRGGD